MLNKRRERSIPKNGLLLKKLYNQQKVLLTKLNPIDTNTYSR